MIIAFLIAGLAGALVVTVAVLAFSALMNKIKTRLAKLKDGQTEIVARPEAILDIVREAMAEEGRTTTSIQELEAFQQQFIEKTKEAQVVMFDENGMEIIKAEKVDEATDDILNKHDNIIQIGA